MKARGPPGCGRASTGFDAEAATSWPSRATAPDGGRLDTHILLFHHILMNHEGARMHLSGPYLCAANRAGAGSDRFARKDRVPCTIRFRRYADPCRGPRRTILRTAAGASGIRRILPWWGITPLSIGPLRKRRASATGTIRSVASQGDVRRADRPFVNGVVAPRHSQAD